MAGPVHSVETTYEPHRNLITGVVNSRTGILSGPPSAMHRDARASHNPPTHRSQTPANQEPRTVISSYPYTYANNLLGRRETISQGGSAFGMMKLGENRGDVTYND
ncbi:MAG: hypothetical protein KA250_01780 [Verrucomicrobiales bacterium]|jgi:hypothetical protein|nr:hypothetical protein [Verrucomicrobiales bacterium]MBP9225372.1 hypothetical protein [Verrucomicrobiales bacterium]HQZ26922.1 hypothetical protein [Verrucomicrobiales bacterium]